MGNCLSRGTFTPNQEESHLNNDIVLKTVDEDPIPMIDGVENLNGDTKLKEEEDADVPLIVELVDLCIPRNAVDHHTERFHLVKKKNPILIVRRGSPFQIRLTLNRAFNSTKDILCLAFSLKGVPSPSYSQNTEILLPVVSENQEKVPTHWKIQLIEKDNSDVLLQVTPDSNCIVGEWMLEVDSRVKEDREAAGFRNKVEDPLIVLFNPWCEDDTVYMCGEEERREYILADIGLVWRGTKNSQRSCVWNYAQFEDDVLSCSLFLLRDLGIGGQADPIRIVRHISAVLHNRNNKGVMVGNWSGKYKGGTNPSFWSGSQVILQKFFKHKKPVKYGQCYVFSGVFTTVCRALGIACRPVTNFSSAHDTHDSLTVDTFFDCDGRPVDNLNKDSVWNFHAWNEVWMQRPDLLPGEDYGGWQAVDATPLEESDGLYRCGPSSLTAIKRGEVKKAFDTTFVFAEVNADKVYWQYNGPGRPLKLLKTSTDEIGQCISTKAVGKFEREDITHLYKHAESGKEEREVMLRALKQCKDSFSRFYLNEDLEDVKFELDLLDDIIIGSPVTVKLKASHRSEEKGKEFTVTVTLRLYSAFYTGDSQKLIKEDKFNVQLGPGIDQVMTMTVTYEEYEHYLTEECIFLASVMAHVQETGFDFCAQDDCSIKLPQMDIQVDGEIVLNQPVVVRAKFKNPIPKPISKGVFHVSVPGFDKVHKAKLKKTIQVGKDVRVKCHMIPISPGETVVDVRFKSNELDDVCGRHPIYVKTIDEAEKNIHL